MLDTIALKHYEFWNRTGNKDTIDPENFVIIRKHFFRMFKYATGCQCCALRVRNFRNVKFFVNSDSALRIFWTTQISGSTVYEWTHAYT